MWKGACTDTGCRITLKEYLYAMATLEDLDRRVSVLEKAAEREKTIERAVAEIVDESEKRVMGEVKADEARLTAVANATEKRITDLLNEKFDAVMVALDRKHNPPS